MTKHFIVSISFDGEEEHQYTALPAGLSGLGLCRNGVTWQENSDALLNLDEYNVLKIVRIGNVRVIIERSGRWYDLKKDHPIDLLVGDVVYVGEDLVHRFEIKHLYKVYRKTSVLARLSKKAMIASAAALAMTVMPACNRTVDDVPNSGSQSEQTSIENDGKSNHDGEDLVVEHVEPNIVEEQQLAGDPMVPDDDLKTIPDTDAEDNKAPDASDAGKANVPSDDSSESTDNQKDETKVIEEKKPEARLKRLGGDVVPHPKNKE